MRNFWIDGRIDGRKTSLAGGPRRKDGGFYLKVYQKKEGTSVLAVTITGDCCGDNTLILRIEPEPTDQPKYTIITNKDKLKIKKWSRKNND